VSAPTWLIELPTCDSTNSWALAHAEALAHGACVWTQRQTAGRGRGANRWYAPPGVLTASFALHLPGALAARQLSLASGLAVAHAVEDLVPRARVAIKWPNDCYLDDRKLAGVLCERPGSSDTVVVGIGLNLDPRWDQSPEQLPFAIASTASVAEACAGEGGPAVPSALDTLAALRRYLIEAAGLISANGWAQLMQPLRNRDWLRGKKVSVADGGTTVAGSVVGIDADGKLVLNDGPKQHKCTSGTVTVVDNNTDGSSGRSSRWFRNTRRKSTGAGGAG
jgi:BirA family biotin operon repressor/biotin-[acetyl-CoA-carboxylase] ligase